MKIAVASGKGGTGKTTISTNLALFLSEDRENVVYLDCDVEEPNGHLFLNPVLNQKLHHRFQFLLLTNRSAMPVESVSLFVSIKLW
jgi:MinD superfamily P-loop ATPase